VCEAVEADVVEGLSGEHFKGQRNDAGRRNNHIIK
jgi:hypothetical protein